MASAMPGSAKERQARRAKLFKQQRGKCHWCAGPMTLERSLVAKQDYATFEHLTPRSEGGSSDDCNVVLVHHKCNR